MESIGNLMNTVQRNIQLHESLKNKEKYSSLLKEVLVNNLSEEEVKWVLIMVYKRGNVSESTFQ